MVSFFDCCFGVTSTNFNRSSDETTSPGQGNPKLRNADGSIPKGLVLVTIKRKLPGEKLGCILKGQTGPAGEFLSVVSVSDKGILAETKSAHCAHPPLVRAGDKILEVNDVSGDAERMLSLINSNLLTFDLVIRPVETTASYNQTFDSPKGIDDLSDLKQDKIVDKMLVSIKKRKARDEIGIRVEEAKSRFGEYKVLKIVSIEKGSLLDKVNCGRRSEGRVTEARPGDEIVQVNGICHDVSAMQKRLDEDLEIEMWISVIDHARHDVRHDVINEEDEPRSPRVLERELLVLQKKSENEKFGFVMKEKYSKTQNIRYIVVESVMDGSLLSEVNKKRKAMGLRGIRAGDRILEVNEISNDVEAMLHEMNTQKRIEIWLHFMSK